MAKQLILLFAGCYNLKSFVATEVNAHFSSKDGVLFDKSTKTLLAYPNAKGSDYKVPDLVEKIGVSPSRRIPCSGGRNRPPPESVPGRSSDRKDEYSGVPDSESGGDSAPGPERGRRWWKNLRDSYSFLLIGIDDGQGAVVPADYGLQKVQHLAGLH